MTARLEWLTELIDEWRATAKFRQAQKAIWPDAYVSKTMTLIQCADELEAAMRRILEASSQEAETPPQAWLCEQHPFTFWPHGDCAGPGVLVCGCGTCPQCTRPATTEAR